MSRIVITIDTGNAAFEDEPGYEVGRILKEVANAFQEIHGSSFRDINRVVLRDINGNRVGQVITEEDREPDLSPGRNPCGEIQLVPLRRR